jgi:hypothetical protein
MNGKFDLEKKKQRLKNTQDLQRKTPPPPPEQATNHDLPSLPGNPSPQQV